MAEVTDYTKYLPTEPPESVIKEIRDGYFTRELLIYKMDSYYEPLEDRIKRAVRCTCTACGETVYLEKVPGRDYRFGTNFGFYNPAVDLEIFDQEETICPSCGEIVKVMHSSHFSAGGYGSIYQTQYPVTVHNIKGGLALLYWEVRRYINKDARQTVITLPYDGYIFFKKKKICVTGREQAFFQKRYLFEWKQLRRYRVDVGWSIGEDIFFIDPLDGTEAENCKLDMYCDTDEEISPVRYMELWQKYPNIENLVMQGFGEYVNYLMQSCVAYTSSYYVRRVCDVKQIAKKLNLKKSKPHEILGISREELRTIRNIDLTCGEFDYYRMARNMGVTFETLRMAMKACDSDTVKRLYPFGADLTKTVRYLNKQRYKFPNDETCPLMLADYWTMAKENGEDMTQNDVLFPARLKNAHDTALRHKKWKEDEALRIKFAERFKDLKVYCFSFGGISIHPAESEKEMIVEGKFLKHCVATYANRHASGETSIFFIRREDKPDEPYFTLEFNFECMRVVQNRGLKNCARTKEVQEFEDRWIEYVKKTAEKERKAA